MTRRTPLQTVKPMSRQGAKKSPGLAQRVATALGTALQHQRSESSVFRSKAHRQNVAALACVCCGLEKHSQAAHLNLLALGKGMGLKTSDALTIPLCCTRIGAIGCHVRLDSSGQYDKATSEGLQIGWLQKTRTRLMVLGRWPADAEADVVRLVGAYLARRAA
ncbi:hypothetical protein [Pusillimonas sp. ANT_WB101]|uniref:hypothetical protein n=1 Tax=Pusillimonas sp. ANT_WB101 TaxID=2597356 RepID=UPI0011EE7C8A|nr:hypothetical protein [Pusillimonas sp. ANT_WB101]KAA0910663.1 hypothetical protein FQ179_01945 [Pusillimonas sp. ANT_WB101]